MSVDCVITVCNHVMCLNGVKGFYTAFHVMDLNQLIPVTLHGNRCGGGDYYFAGDHNYIHCVLQSILSIC